MSGAEIERRVEEVATEIVEAQGLSLVDVEYRKESGEWVLRLYIYKNEGVNLDDCEIISNLIDARLDEIDIIPGSYLLEVSSPGLERRLRKEREYTIFSGRRVKINTYAPVNGNKEFVGILNGIEDGMVKVTLSENEARIPLKSISKAQLVYDPQDLFK